MSTITNLKDEALDRIGRRIDAAWKRLHESKDAYVEASVELMQALREGRIQCGDNDSAFGAWLKQTGRDYLEKNDRAALIKAADDLDAAREALTKTKSRSYQHIAFPHVRKGRQKRTSRAKKPKIDIDKTIKERDALQKENDKLRERIRFLEGLLHKRGVFTKTQFRQLQMCVHPDSSASISVRNDLTAFLLDNERKLVRLN